MNLPVDFHFSSSNLQDYLTCERRFELKAIQQCLWPALPSQPVQEQEEHMRNGVLFHQFVNQYFLGISADEISNLIQDASMLHWWNNFVQAFGPDETSSFIAFEYTLAGYLQTFPILAKLDAIRVKEDHWIIYDWKTGLHLPKQQTMAKKIQSRLYPYILTKYGANLNHGKPLMPDQISMLYWSPEFPTQQLVFPYSAAKYEEDEQYLGKLISEITEKTPGSFELTKNENDCLFCVYRSLCGRGTIAGDFSSQNLDQDRSEHLETFLTDLDIDQIPEIAF